MMDGYALIYIPKAITFISEMPVFEFQLSIANLFCDGFIKKNKKERAVRISKKHIAQLESVLSRSKGLGKDNLADQMWHKTFTYDRTVYQRNIIRDEEYLIKESNLREFYMSTLFSVLDLSEGPPERMVHRLTNDEDPESAASAQKDPKKVQKDNTDHDELCRYRVYKNVGVSNLPSVSFSTMFTKMSARMIVSVFEALLIEKSVVFFSKTPGEIPLITEAILALASPLTWSCVYVPRLPS
mmetsp:Transcript_13049/g.11153  ORF Transcript_13049/g.11153 Transcript_13049/m.11153 type:complete len:241 (+) Transcript_13049:507-1229(+)